MNSNLVLRSPFFTVKDDPADDGAYPESSFAEFLVYPWLLIDLTVLASYRFGSLYILVFVKVLVVVYLTVVCYRCQAFERLLMRDSWSSNDESWKQF